MQEVLTYIQAHWDDLFTIIGIAVSLATAITKLTPSTKDDAIVAKIAAVIEKLSVLKKPKA